ncbi:efflux RND transporter permease subunit [candidate division CSSED10-310 bacterium]|uniref:Efflux RND transporter permease subunit n=1 Tax=candidate division CSSED10-310 bacterium TaxID=2855610 RepID=A0ABV6YVT2_UNCC1
MNEAKISGPIAWMARNSVAANLLMLFLVIGGIMTAFIIKQEIFPQFDVDIIMVAVPYPGTSPEEVEEGIILAVEEAIRDLEGIKRIQSLASEGMANIFIRLLSNADRTKVLSDVKNSIDSIRSFPEGAERPSISLLEHKIDVISIVLYGALDEHNLHDLAEQIREDLLQLPEISAVTLTGARSQEISIEIPQESLRMYNLTLEDVARKIRSASVDYSAGGVKAGGGEILLRVKERREVGKEFGDVPIVSSPDGTAVRLADIATVVDGFADTDEAAYFNGQRSIMIKVSSEGEQTPLEVAAVVKNYLSDLRTRLPPTISVTTFDDYSEIYADRMNLLLRNGLIGLVLVLMLLGLLLNIRLAFWVTMGIPISFLGALLFLPFFDVTINMISLFAFIMGLGIVVDDAIIVGENIFTHRKNMGFIKAAIFGARQVSVPVTFAILTNIIAFLPLLFVEGTIGKVFRVIPIVVCLAFFMSLIEAMFILPAHLAHTRQDDGKVKKGLSGLQNRISIGLERKIQTVYRPLLEHALHSRYLTLTLGLGLLIIVLGYVISGRMEFSFSPKAEADIVAVGLELPFGSPVEQTERIQAQLVREAQRILAAFGGEANYEGIFTHIGKTDIREDVDTGLIEGGHAASIRVILAPIDERNFSGEQFSSRWREAMGEIPGIESITFKVLEHGPPAGRPIDIQLIHRDTRLLEEAAVELGQELKNFKAAQDIDDGFAPGKPQLDFRVKPEAYSLGITPAVIGSQVRSRFYGAEALRLQRGRHEVKVMVRLPEKDRRTELSIEEMLIRSPQGGEVPLGEAATVSRGRAYTSIKRNDCHRVLNVTADVQPPSQKSSILAALQKEVMPRFQEKYPDLTYSLEGEHRETGESMNSLVKNYIIALIAIFVMLGVIFKSYIQPLIVMVSIPFGIIGAVIGHLIMGYNLSVISMLGITALSGVVLNDSLILIDYANRKRREGLAAREAIVAAGVRRFRPIILTTLTTFFGLAPMIFETSFQARILVPMAISLGYGILFATMIILLLVPSIYLIFEDIRKLLRLADSEGVVPERVSSTLA